MIVAEQAVHGGAMAPCINRLEWWTAIFCRNCTVLILAPLSLPREDGGTPGAAFWGQATDALPVAPPDQDYNPMHGRALQTGLTQGPRVACLIATVRLMLIAVIPPAGEGSRTFSFRAAQHTALKPLSADENICEFMMDFLVRKIQYARLGHLEIATDN